MSFAKQAPEQEKHWFWRCVTGVKISVTLGLCALASGCVMSVMGSAKQPAVDTGVRTGAVVSATSAAPADSAASSDMLTIRNAVTSTDLAQSAIQPLAWANAETGSRGIIEKIQQYEDQSRLCRKFEVSRESFNGVAMFDGDACVANNGEWMVRRFEQR